MIIDPVLDAWLRAPDRQAETVAAIRAFGRRWRESPAIAALRRDLGALQTRNAAGLVEAARAFMARAEAVDVLLAETIAQAAADPFFRPPFRLIASDIHTGLLLFDEPDLSISVGAVPLDALAATKTASRGPTSIFFTGQWTLFHFVKSGGANLSFWEAPPIEAGFTGEGSGRCRLAGRRRIEDGETLVMDGRSQSFVFDHADADMVILQALIGAEAAPLTVGYDSDTLAFAGASSTDEESSRTQMLVSLLRLMDRGDAAPLLAEALASPHFYTRWHVMRELLALDGDAALPRLRDMALRDPHPEIRGIAARTLSLLFAEAEQEEPVPCPA